MLHEVMAGVIEASITARPQRPAGVIAGPRGQPHRGLSPRSVSRWSTRATASFNEFVTPNSSLTEAVERGGPFLALVWRCNGAGMNDMMAIQHQQEQMWTLGPQLS